VKITGVRSVLYEYELTRPIGDANKVSEGDVVSGMRRRADLAVFVSTDEGLEGVAVASSSAQSALQGVAAIVAGDDPRAVRGLWERMTASAFKWGNEGSVATAIAAVDNALWDLRAKIHGVPLWRELGATTRRVKAYASGLDMPLSDSEVRDYYAGMATKGITAGKLKVGLDLDEDLRRLAIMQDALGGRACRPTLLVDANEYWSPKQAIRRMAAMEREFDIAWCEEPVRRWDYRGLRQVSRSIRAAVATGENLKDISQFVPLLTHEAVDVVQVNPNMAGITACLRIADLAFAFDRPVALMNSAGRYGAHLAAALPHHTMMEVLDVGRDAVFSRYDSVIEDGWIVLGDAPGSGITFDAEALARHRVERPEQATARLAGGRGHLAAVREGPTRIVRGAE
jgi:L-alanine-DL-glutamate epimerase-like enolase superfamily enzyme